MIYEGVYKLDKIFVNNDFKGLAYSDLKILFEDSIPYAKHLIEGYANGYFIRDNGEKDILDEEDRKYFVTPDGEIDYFCHKLKLGLILKANDEKANKFPCFVANENFIREMISDYDISIKQINNTWNQANDFKIEVIIFGVNTREETQNILDDCVLLNTYLNYYFLKNGYISSYSILNNLYSHNYQIDEDEFKEPRITINYDRGNHLIINELVRYNTSASKEKYLANYNYNKDYWIYDFSYIQLRENLGKVKNN